MKPVKIQVKTIGEGAKDYPFSTGYFLNKDGTLKTRSQDEQDIAWVIVNLRKGKPDEFFVLTLAELQDIIRQVYIDKWKADGKWESRIRPGIASRFRTLPDQPKWKLITGKR